MNNNKRNEESIEKIAGKKADLVIIGLMMFVMIVFPLVDALTGSAMSKATSILYYVTEIVIIVIFASTPFHDLIEKSFIISENAKREKTDKENKEKKRKKLKE